MCGTTPGSICDKPCPRMLGLPLSMSGTTPISGPEVPCALRRLVRDGVSRKILGSFSEYGCQWPFFEWVEKYRSEPGIEQDELKMCPLLWCRRTFDSKESVIRHVSGCPHLSKGWYWCPYHRYPERFLECNQYCKTISKFRSRNKDYKLHLADRFLNWIRHRRSENRTDEVQARTTLDGAERLECKKELSTGFDNERFESPGSDPESSRVNGYPMMTECMNEKARYPGDRYGIAKYWGDDVCLSELSSHKSMVRPTDEMCDPSPHRHEMYDSSFPLEFPTSPPIQRQESPELQDLTKSEPGPRGLSRRTHRTPASNSRSSSAKQFIDNWPNDCELGQTTSPAVREASKKDELSHSTFHKQSDRDSWGIFVSTDISRESSDSSGTSMESRVETRISSSPRPKSLDLNGQVPTLPQRKSLNLNQPLQSIMHRLSSRTSASYSDAEIVKCASRSTLPDIIQSSQDMSWESNSQHEPSLMNLSPTEIDISMDEILAGNILSDDPTRPEERGSPYQFWDTVSPSTLTSTADYSASCAVSPSSATLALSSPLSGMFSPVSPIADTVSPQPNVISPATGTREGPDLGLLEHHGDAASGWTLESVTAELERTRSAFNTTGPSLPIQCPISYPAVSSASEAQWKNVDHRVQFEGLRAPSLCTQTCLSRIQSSDLAASIDLTSVVLESGAPSSTIKPSMAQFDTSNAWSPDGLLSVPLFTPPEQDMDLSFMDGSTETVREGMRAFIPVDINADDHGLCKLPSPVGGTGSPSPLSPAHSPEKRPGVTLSSRRQMNVPHLAIPSRRGPSATSRCLTPSLVSRRSRSKDSHKIGSEVASSECDMASAYHRQPDLLNALNSPSSAGEMQHCFDHGSLLVTHSVSKQTQVKELQVLVGAVNRDWMQMLKTVPELWLRCSLLSPRSLFEKGIWTLREHLCGRFAQNFEDIFAFIHVAFAAAFLLHCQQSFYCLNAFYDDALQWQHALPHEKDRIVFLKAMDRWRWLPKLQSTSSLHTGRRVRFDSFASPESTKYVHKLDRLNALRNSKVLKVCIGFLDGFEEADIGERNVNFPAEELTLRAQTRKLDVEHMIKNITLPILQERGIEALQRIVIDTAYRIARGLLQNPREVEVTLNTSGRWSSESAEVFERYHNIVTSQCDKAMPSSGSDWYPAWRNGHYIDDLDRVLEMSQHQLDMSEFEVISPNQPILDSPAPWSSVSNGPGTLNSSPMSAVSWTSTGSSKRTEVRTPTTSLTTLSRTPVSPTSLAPITPTTSEVSCQTCFRRFKGSPQDAKSNLQRHVREFHRHNSNAGVKCPQPECLMRRPMRSDNLGPHLLKRHKMSATEIKRIKSRLSARKMNSGGTARRRSERE